MNWIVLNHTCRHGHWRSFNFAERVSVQIQMSSLQVEYTFLSRCSSLKTWRVAQAATVRTGSGNAATHANWASSAESKGSNESKPEDTTTRRVYSRCDTSPWAECARFSKRNAVAAFYYLLPTHKMNVNAALVAIVAAMVRVLTNQT